MRARRAATAVLAAALALASAPDAGARPRDDTAWLQARLDAGGSVFLPKLADGSCYATRGLWVSRDDTTVDSDGACIVALGPGEVRLRDAFRPRRATAVFFVSHSSIFRSQPVRIALRGLRLVVPASTRMAGVAILGHEVTLDHVGIGGAPSVDVLVGDRVETAQRVAIFDSTLTGGKRDIVAAIGAIDLRIERSTLAGGRRLPHARPASGVHVRLADRGQPTLDVRIAGNAIADNAGPGILLDLEPKNGPPVLASGIEVAGNRVLGNAHAAPAAERGGIVVRGGQRDGQGRLLVNGNVVRGNGGPALRGVDLRFLLRRSANDLRGNEGGAAAGLRRVRPAAEAGRRWTPPAALLARAGRDDTAWLQARLDAGGGPIFLPRLPGGRCYATRGLWVSRDGTSIDSDGACLVALGPGPVRLRSPDGDPIRATALFFVNRSRLTEPTPVGVSIANLRLTVPFGSMAGVAVAGHDVTLRRLEIGGTPMDDVVIGGRANGNGYVANVHVLESTLGGAGRNAISAFGVIGLRIEGNTIEGVRDSLPGLPAAGIDVEPDERSQPTRDVRIARNVIQDNAGPGVLLSLDSNSGPAVIATALEVSGNTIQRNSAKRTPPTRAGVAVVGGQDGGGGTLVLRDNVIRDNGGPGILSRLLKLVVQASGNELTGNERGSTVEEST